MSTLPCDGHGTQVRGKLLGFYGTLVKDGVRFGTYRRYCQDCMARLLADHRTDWSVGVLGPGYDGSPSCTSCGELHDDGHDLRPFYVTTYVRPDQRVDYSARYCDNCAELIKDAFSLEEKKNGR